MTPGLDAVVGIVTVLLITIAAWWRESRREQAYEEVVSEGEPAFETELWVSEIRDGSISLDEVRGKIDRIYIQRTPEGTGGGYGGGGIKQMYTAFAIDVNGEPHDVSRGRDWGEVERDARWLGSRLDVPVEDVSYG